jgi:hypothetical protein
MRKNVDRNAFSQINLRTSKKLHIVVAWMRYIRDFQVPVPRDDQTVRSFIQQSCEPTIMRLRGPDAWLQEHVARLFWTCIDMGLLEYQYPYPHNGQSYSPTRLGRILGAVPKSLAVGILRSILTFEAIAGPIKHFTTIRNVVALVTAVVSWYSNPQIQAVTLAVISGAAAIVSTWLAYFLTSSEH